MSKYVILLSALLGAAWAMPQYAGGSAGGLLEHYGEPLKHEVIGLSRGIEIDHYDDHKEEEPYHRESHHEPYHHELQHEEYQEEGHHEDEHYHRGEGGFGGSDFKTPVDVHHEKAVHLKAHPEYHYDYHVADHKHKDYKSKHEERDGYKVKGSYSLLEPDHKTIRVVDYIADKKTGFIARVSYKKHQ